jgi:hypothetical protein
MKKKALHDVFTFDEVRLFLDRPFPLSSYRSSEKILDQCPRLRNRALLISAPSGFHGAIEGPLYLSG